MDLDKQLIKEVKNHRVLYDPTHTMNKDILLKQQIWIEIGRKLIGGEDETTSVAALKVRWKSLRDAYVKERKYDMAKSCGIKLKYKKPWRLKKQMEFLAPFIHNRKDFLFDSTKDKNANDFSSNSHSKGSGIFENINNVKPVSEVSKQIVEYKTKSFNQSVSNFKNKRIIEIDSFFRGISDVVKSLTPANQLIVQKEIATLIMNYKLRELDEEDQRNQ